MTSARLVAALLLSAAPTAAAAQTPPISIGVADWTHPDAFGTRPAEPTRGLVPGEYVVLQEEVETNDVGAADFLFANQPNNVMYAPIIRVNTNPLILLNAVNPEEALCGFTIIVRHWRQYRRTENAACTTNTASKPYERLGGK